MRQMVRGNGMEPGETKQQHSSTAENTKRKKRGKEAGQLVQPGQSHCRQHEAISEAWCARERDGVNAGRDGR